MGESIEGAGVDVGAVAAYKSVSVDSAVLYL